jgi:hypothetical protein
MELYLQFGYGMMALSRELVEEWEGGTVILSPRDLTSDQCQRLSNAIRSLPNGKVYCLIHSSTYLTLTTRG